MEAKFFHRDVEKFILSLQKPTIAKTLRTIELLERFGHKLGMPHSKKVHQHIFELRVRGIQEVRILYVLRGNEAFLLHGFLKKSDRIPKRELERALQLSRELART